MNKLKTYFFFLTIFVTGAVILIIEILGARILTPFYGSTIYVWSSLIAITLAALALGYWLGGKLADKRPDIDLIYWIIFTAGILILIIPIYDKSTLINTDNLGLKFGPLVAALFLFGPSIFFLGMISPFAIKIRTRALKNLGMTAGNLYALATLGSLFGGLLAGFYLVPTFPAKSILLILGLILVFFFLIWQLLKLKK